MNIIWPKKLFSPKIELGISLEKGLKILSRLGNPIEELEGKEVSYRVNSSEFDVAIYETDGIVTSVWFNDSLGRIWAKGKAMKIRLYLARYGNPDDWELRIDNGWMHYYFNDKAGCNMVYGVDNDVIRFNLQQSA